MRRARCRLCLAGMPRRAIGPRIEVMSSRELLEIRLLTFGLGPRLVSEPVLGGRKAIPTWNGCSQVHRLPKWVTRRFVELAELREERIDEFCSPLVSRRAFWPVE